MPQQLDPTKLPAALQSIVPFAEKWGFEEEGEICNAVDNATMAELHDLIHCFDNVEEQTLVDWLCGEHPREHYISREYGAVHCLTIAFDLAKIRLKGVAARDG